MFARVGGALARLAAPSSPALSWPSSALCAGVATLAAPPLLAFAAPFLVALAGGGLARLRRRLGRLHRLGCLGGRALLRLGARALLRLRALFVGVAAASVPAFAVPAFAASPSARSPSPAPPSPSRSRPRPRPSSPWPPASPPWRASPLPAAPAPSLLAPFAGLRRRLAELPCRPGLTPRRCSAAAFARLIPGLLRLLRPVRRSGFSSRPRARLARLVVDAPRPPCHPPRSSRHLGDLRLVTPRPRPRLLPRRRLSALPVFAYAPPRSLPSPCPLLAFFAVVAVVSVGLGGGLWPPSSPCPHWPFGAFEGSQPPPPRGGAIRLFADAADVLAFPAFALRRRSAACIRSRLRLRRRESRSVAVAFAGLLVVFDCPFAFAAASSPLPSSSPFGSPSRLCRYTPALGRYRKRASPGRRVNRLRHGPDHHNVGPPAPRDRNERRIAVGSSQSPMHARRPHDLRPRSTPPIRATNRPRNAGDLSPHWGAPANLAQPACRARPFDPRDPLDLRQHRTNCSLLDTRGSPRSSADCSFLFVVTVVPLTLIPRSANTSTMSRRQADPVAALDQRSSPDNGGGSRCPTRSRSAARAQGR